MSNNIEIMSDEEIKHHLEAVILWCNAKIISGQGSNKENYYYIAVLESLRALLTEETLSQFFERRVLNPNNFPFDKLEKVGDKWVEKKEDIGK